MHVPPTRVDLPVTGATFSQASLTWFGIQLFQTPTGLRTRRQVHLEVNDSETAEVPCAAAVERLFASVYEVLARSPNPSLQQTPPG
jgi:hypothetical protein